MGKTPQAEVFAALQRERAYQDRKWGTIDQHPHTIAEWLLIIESELNEAKEAWVKQGGNLGALQELIQVGSVVLAALEQHGLVERPQVFTAVALPEGVIPRPIEE